MQQHLDEINRRVFYSLSEPKPCIFLSSLLLLSLLYWTSFPHTILQACFASISSNCHDHYQDAALFLFTYNVHDTCKFQSCTNYSTSICTSKQNFRKNYWYVWTRWVPQNIFVLSIIQSHSWVLGSADLLTKQIELFIIMHENYDIHTSERAMKPNVVNTEIQKMIVVSPTNDV